MGENSDKEKLLWQYYNDLNRFGVHGEYERALKTLNKIIGLTPPDETVFYCKVVCFIHLNRIDDALKLLNKVDLTVKNAFENVYCLYRKNRHEEALRIIRRYSLFQDILLEELKAQILYRIEDFNESVDVYKDLISSEERVEDDYKDERHTNLLASFVFSNREVDLESAKENTYEHSFNIACFLIRKEMYAEAEKKLKSCEKMYREQLIEDEMTEEEINKEIAIIRVQLSYIYQKQGRLKEAQQLNSEIFKTKIEDQALLAVASNNALCMNKDQNLFDSKKKMKNIINESLNNKLRSVTRETIAFNNAILSYYLNQLDSCLQLCDQIDQYWPKSEVKTAVLRSCVFWKMGKTEETFRVLADYKPKDSFEMLYRNLATAHHYLVKGDKEKACEFLENLGEFRYRPAIVATLTTIYLSLGKEEKASELFIKSDGWLRNKAILPSMRNMWRQAADFHLKYGQAKLAVGSLKQLILYDLEDKKVIAELVLAYAQYNVMQALLYTRKLPSIEELSKGLDIDALQNMTVTTLGAKKVGTKPDSQPSTPRLRGEERKKTHKKKKGKLPKNCDLSVPPDPERWLPKYERSGYRKKRDRRVKEVIKGSQGVASGQADQYDFSGKQIEQQEVTTPEPAPRVHLKKQQKKKKRN